MLRPFSPILQHRSKVRRWLRTRQVESSQSHSKEYPEVTCEMPQHSHVLQCHRGPAAPSPAHTALSLFLSVLILTSHRSRTCSAFRGVTFISHFQSQIYLVVQSLTPQSQADSLLCITYPIKLEHHKQVGEGGTGAEIGQMKPWIKSGLAAEAQQYCPETHPATVFVFKSMLSAALESTAKGPECAAFTTYTCENNCSHSNTDIFKTIMKE